MSSPLKTRAFRCDNPTWEAASRRAEQRGENLSAELRRFLRRYARPRPTDPASPTVTTEQEAAK